jgi:hypothetical protein
MGRVRVDCGINEEDEEEKEKEEEKGDGCYTLP